MIDFEDTFETTDSGATSTYPMSAGDVKKGGLMCIESRPCKVVSIEFHKTGKHGHAKATIVGIDIFTHKKFEDSIPASFTIEVPNITRKEYSLFSVDEENFCSLLDVVSNEMRSDIKLPDETEDDESLSKRIIADLEEGKEMNVTVLGGMGIEKIIDMKLL